MTLELSTGTERVALQLQSDDLSLTPEQRYAIVGQEFPEWLIAEPIEFPPHHTTFGWACRVPSCEGTISATYSRQLCDTHRGIFAGLKDSVGFEKFIAEAKPLQPSEWGRALQRRPDCAICGSNREAVRYVHHGDLRDGLCKTHINGWKRSSAKGARYGEWLDGQSALPALPSCVIPRCVHDADHRNVPGQLRICTSHLRAWENWFRRTGDLQKGAAWDVWFRRTADGPSVAPSTDRGLVTLRRLTPDLQREIRYAIYRHASTPRRRHWMPKDIQRAVDSLAESGVSSLADAAVARIATQTEIVSVRTILQVLPFAARGLMVTEQMAKESGWFDPILVGGAPFPGTQGDANRRKPWDLSKISQRWLRDALWDHLRDEALKPTGKRPCSKTVHCRITGFILLSDNLRNIRGDRGEFPELLTSTDAKAVTDIWAVWYRERCPIPQRTDRQLPKPATLSEANRASYMMGVRTVLHDSHNKRRTPTAAGPFIFNLPAYARPANNPRPRPLTYGDFQLLVSPEAIAALAAADSDDIGIADIWLTQAFQGGRVSETLRLKLGCIGLVGAAQPYIWRDISKVGVLDYGMPCYLPVYERILIRREKTLAKLRHRYADELAALDERGRERLEAQWDRTMPLCPSNQENPDLRLELSQSWFRKAWSTWFTELGLTGITTHQTRATLATSLLNNGAPPALVRQLLGHFSTEALAHYAAYNNDSMTRHLQKVWAAGPGMDKPGTILLRPSSVVGIDPASVSDRIDLTVIPVEHGLCRYGPVVGGAQCPFQKNCTTGPLGPCEHFVLTGADLSYWERKRDAAYHFAEGAPSDEARDYILSQWAPWDPVLANLRDALDELGLLDEAQNLDLRSPLHDYFDPLFSTGWQLSGLNPIDQHQSDTDEEES